MAKHFIIYESRNRLTGTLMRTLDLRHADCPPAVREKAKDNRYAATCVDHGVVVFFQEHYPAGRAIAHSGEAKRTPDDKEQGWCAKCVAMVGKGEKVARPAKAAEATAPAANPRRAANQAAQSRQAAAKKPGPVTTKRAPRKATPRKAATPVAAAPTAEAEPVEQTA